MTTAAVIGSCLSGMTSAFLMNDYKWVRPSNAAIIRSDYFVGAFLDGVLTPPNRDEFRARFQWKEGMEVGGEQWFGECFRDTVGTFEVTAGNPGLFEVLDTQKIDVILMDNLHDTHQRLLRNDDPKFAAPFSLSRCANEIELGREFHYGPLLSPIESARNWARIVAFVRAKQPEARIIFHCAHGCDAWPDRQTAAAEFHDLFRLMGRDAGAEVVAPFALPYELTRLPEDPDHFEWSVYRAMAGRIFLEHALWRGQRAPQTQTVPL